ncbi:MAG: group 1 glycosyl transferase [Parcubacteria group bacterium Athens0714_26]|nr:MAG: group 1 glycosyl transferase [Parcubacteria group bacterium Athens1014_26]TSD02536.1 MAG: group 1 glycosyl transferase [Parcubacteria group bacterium Athens0714_26]
MLSLLTEELVARNYDVTLFASGDSKTSAKLIPLTEKGIWLQKGLRSPHAYINTAIEIIYKHRNSFDLFHNHFDFFMFPLCLSETIPMLTTLHRPMDPVAVKAYKTYGKIKFCAISRDQQRSAEENGIPIEDVVYNGIIPEKYVFKEVAGDYFMYLGRLNKEKGIVDAINISREAGVKLVVAGNIVGADEWNYFLHEIQPLLNEENVNFVGQVDFNEKVRLLGGAKALLFPIDRREPFGLVMIEAMACGTPVIAYRRGSVPEVVKDKKTGFIVETKEEMIEAIKNINAINRKDCRTHVEQNFTIKQMVDKYEEIYKKLI